MFFPLSDNYSNSTSSYNGNGILKMGLPIASILSRYGFDNATSITATLVYRTKVSAGTGNCRILEDTNGDGVYTALAGSEVTVTETGDIIEKTASNVTIALGSKLYVETKINSIVNQVFINGVEVILKIN